MSLPTSESQAPLTDLQVLQRLTAASHALGVVERMRDIADDVSAWEHDRIAPEEIDRRIIAWLEAERMGYQDWLEEPDVASLLSRFPGIDAHKFWDAYGFEKWVIECVRSIAFTDDPAPFLPFTAGFMIDLPDADPPLVIAVMTPFTIPELAGRQVAKRLKEVFGDTATRMRKDEVESARILRMHNEGMSHREIAIQTLRVKYPDIVKHAHKYRSQINREKQRIAKAIPAEKRVWKERWGESSTPKETS